MEPGLLTVAVAGAPGTPRERGETQARCEVHWECVAERPATAQGPWERRTGVPMLHHTLHGFATLVRGVSRQEPTVRDDVRGSGRGWLAMLTDAVDGPRRAVWAPILTGVPSPQMFV
jgi:hypothetical protein